MFARRECAGIFPSTRQMRFPLARIGCAAPAIKYTTAVRGLLVLRQAEFSDFERLAASPRPHYSGSMYKKTKLARTKHRKRKARLKRIAKQRKATGAGR